MDIHHIFLFAVAAPDDHISIQEKSFFQAAAAAEKDHLCLKIKLGDSRAAVLIFLVILFRIPRSILTVFLFCARFRDQRISPESPSPHHPSFPAFLSVQNFGVPDRHN